MSVNGATPTHAGEEAAALRGRLDPRQLLHAGAVDFVDRDRVAGLLEVAKHAVTRYLARDRVADQQPALWQVQLSDYCRQLLDDSGASDNHSRKYHRARGTRFHDDAVSATFNPTAFTDGVSESDYTDTTA